jgi:hypothetical protein
MCRRDLASNTNFGLRSRSESRKESWAISSSLVILLVPGIGYGFADQDKKRLSEVDLKHHYRIEWRTPALRALRIGEHRVQGRAEYLEIHNGPERLELFAKIA